MIDISSGAPSQFGVAGKISHGKIPTGFMERG